MKYETLSEGENNILMHWSRWGSSGYPICKRGRSWWWDEAFGVKGCPSPFKTKREVFQAFENYIDTLLERAGAEAQAKALHNP